ncbi:MAG: hypothetical protein WC880_05325 [Candidatus Paceibacterota bacterium]
MKKIFLSQKMNWIPTTAGVIVGVFAVVAIVQAATTISTNVQTDGTLAVTGLSSLTTASTTGAVSVAGALWIGGNATTTAAGAISTQSTLTVTGATTLSSTLGVTGLTSLSTASTTGAVSVAGNLWVGGNATTTSAGAISTQSTMTVGSAGDAVSEIQFGTCTVTIGSITASTTAMATCTATGVTTAFKVFVTPYITNNGIIMTSASSTANDTIQIGVHNIGYTGAIDPADNVWGWMAVR